MSRWQSQINSDTDWKMQQLELKGEDPLLLVSVTKASHSKGVCVVSIREKLEIYLPHLKAL